MMANHPNRNRKTATARKIAPAPRPRRASRPHIDHDYSGLLAAVRQRFAAIARTGEPLFVTDAGDLEEIYLDALPSQRQFHTCSACRRFLKTYGSLARVNADGLLESAMWQADAAPTFYAHAFAALDAAVRVSKIVSVFKTSKAVWGVDEAGPWQHFCVAPPADLVYRPGVLTAGQAMAAARENVNTVRNALAEFTAPMLDQALRLFETDSLDRSEKFVGPLRWLRALHDRPGRRRGENLLWKVVATAPEGFCHPKASVVAPLLADIAAGLPFEDIKAKHAAKMNPLIYQRPQAAPSAGNIKAAEALVEKLGLAPALDRRFARLDELQTIWTPKPPVGAKPRGTTKVFGHLDPKAFGGVPPVNLPAVTMTWDKFARVVLPGADRIELWTPHHGRFIALTTAADLDAPPILKWDRADARNPVAWYVYPGGSAASQWRLRGGDWAQVNAVAALPNLWGDRPMPFLSDGVVLVIDGAVDTKTGSGNALFPECLRDDLHGIRSTVEAYSRRAEMLGRDAGSACGYDVRKGVGMADCSLRVFAGGAWTRYQIDRWD